MKDYFVSYNRHDRDWAEWIAWQLEEAGYAVVIQAWDFLPGENLVLNMHRAAQEARRTIAVLSETYLASVYTQAEWAAAFNTGPTSTARTLLPVRVRDCQPAGLLASIVYVDLVGLAPDEARTRLLAAAQGDRVKPLVSPAFPGTGRQAPAFPVPARGGSRDDFARQLAEQADQLLRTLDGLLVAGASPEEIQSVEARLRELKRQRREGPQLQKGDRLSHRYLLLENVGSGGFATVWRARDEKTRQQVAVKVLHGQHSDSAERHERFCRGARAMQQLCHPHVVRILDLDQEDRGYHYFVMEYVAGGTFVQAVTSGVLPLEKRLAVVAEVGDALAFAHERGIVHRDVTPDNILLDASTGSARLADFDLVRLADSTGGTRTGALGKYVYAAPECMESANEADARCDIYSLGMTAIFAFHGKKLPHAALRQWGRFLDSLLCSRAIKDVLARATAPDPEDRFASVKEFSAALREAAARGSDPEPAGPSTLRLRRPPVPVGGEEFPLMADALERDRLLEIGNTLSRTLDLSALLTRIADSLFELFRQADRCFIIQAEGDRLLLRAVKTRRPGDEENAHFSKELVHRCLDGAEALLDEAGKESIVCAPLCRADGKAFGVIQLVARTTGARFDPSTSYDPDHGKRFTQRDLDLLCGVANQASIALENARLMEGAIRQERLQRDLQVAAQVHGSFLPPRPPVLPGYEFAGFSESASAVGGDYYGYIPLPGGRMVVAVGDVAGKGVAASLLMAKLASDIRFAMLSESDPGKAMARLNDLLCEVTLQLDRFVTLVAVVLDPVAHTATLISAGQPSPLLYRPSTGEVTDAMPQDAVGMPLGVMEGYPFDTHQITLAPGDSLVLFTDGVNESKNVNGEDFRMEGVERVLRGAGNAGPKQLVERLVGTVKQHIGDRNLHDDLTVVVFGRTA